MFGRSRSTSTSQSGGGTMSDLAKGASKLEDVAKSYNSFQNDMMGKAFPAFGEMVQSAMSKFGDNPMSNIMGAALGLPIQLEAPDFMQGFIDKYRKKPEPEVAPATPQTYNVNDDMRARLQGSAPAGLGPYGRAMHNAPNLYQPGGPLYHNGPLVGDIAGVKRNG